MSISDIITRFPPERDNLLLILHALQNASATNHLSRDDLKAVAAYLNITHSAVYGVATYYSMYATEPRGRHLIRVCKSPVCDMVGSPGITASVERQLGIRVGGTTIDGMFTLEESACLGRCDTAPSMMVDDRYYGGLDDAKLATIIERYRDGR